MSISSYQPPSPQTPTSNTLEKFTLFKSLPIELRFQIWTEIASIPRLIPICIKNIPGRTHPDSLSSEWSTITTQPITLSICRESRSETLHLYRLCFATQLQKPIFFAPASDALIFEDAIAMEGFFSHWWTDQEGTADRMVVRRLACGSRLRPGNDFAMWAQERQVRFTTVIYPNVERIIFIDPGPKRMTKSVLHDLGSEIRKVVKAFEDVQEEGVSVGYVELEEMRSSGG